MLKSSRVRRASVHREWKGGSSLEQGVAESEQDEEGIPRGQVVAAA